MYVYVTVYACVSACVCVCYPAILCLQYPLPEIVVIHRDQSVRDHVISLKSYILEVNRYNITSRVETRICVEFS